MRVFKVTGGLVQNQNYTLVSRGACPREGLSPDIFQAGDVFGVPDGAEPPSDQVMCEPVKAG